MGDKASRIATWLKVTPEGLFCVPGRFHIDPIRPVDRAVITHGHADHARPGHSNVMATPGTLAIMRARFGETAIGRGQVSDYGVETTVGDVSVRLEPAGHVLGSAQVVMRHKGLTAVVSGDYKRRSDPTCAGFALTPCDVFVTEATFGLPVFRHPDTRGEIERLLASHRLFPERTHVVGAYALGKAQRVLAMLRDSGYDAPVYLHGALENLTELYRQIGVPLGATRPATVADKAALKGQIVIAPPSAIADRWARRLTDPLSAFASGWMRVRQRARQRGVELPLIISDHADWDELATTIREVGAEEIWVTHGREEALVHYAHSQGIGARPLALVGFDEEGE